ncbi:MAG: AAA family ATPase [Fimbriimonadales bacterium]
MTRSLPVPVEQIEAYNYKCLRAVRQPLERFHLLVGRNGAGKSVFLDALLFLQSALLTDVEASVFGVPWDMHGFAPRALNDFRDLLYKGQGNAFTLAVVLNLPDFVQEKLGHAGWSRCRYQVQVGVPDGVSEELQIIRESLWLLAHDAPIDWGEPQPILFDDGAAQQSCLWQAEKEREGWREVIRREGQRAYLTTETSEWQISQPLAPDKLALAMVDEERFPAASWVARFLQKDILALQLNPRKMRIPCPATALESLELDGSNLPKVVKRFLEENSEQFYRWVRAVQSVISQLRAIEVHRREEDNALYLVLDYGDYKVKQWAVSEGTLRLLALTLVGYLPQQTPRVWIIEEPENGVHPQALEAIIQALATAQGNQFLIATHSPIALGFKDYVTPQTLLCFRQGESGTVIQSGADLIREGSPSLGRLLEWGVL